MDGMNYIKGYRYQMYCAAREAQVRVCTVRIKQVILASGTNPLTVLNSSCSSQRRLPSARSITKTRRSRSDIKTARAVKDRVRSDCLSNRLLARLDNLIQRFEEPNSMARWDSPLFTVTTDDHLPVNAIWESVTSGNKAPTNVAVLQVWPLRLCKYAGVC